MRLLPVLLVCVAAALAAPAPDSDHYGIPDSVYSMFKVGSRPALPRRLASLECVANVVSPAVHRM